MIGYDPTKERKLHDPHPIDRGCQESPKCTDCPLAACKHDNPADYQTSRRKAKDALIVKAITNERLTKEEAAERFRCTSRTIFRVLQRSRPDAKT